ncbi:MAG: hypothetical protein PHF86_06055 [Candidatus Nanoarchaeia archaeon]|nr:hypothetical protein [Candidatus Nanoarchaeia archaeon]
MKLSGYELQIPLEIIEKCVSNIKEVERLVSESITLLKSKDWESRTPKDVEKRAINQLNEMLKK